MPFNLRKEDIQLLWLIQPNLQDQELEMKKKFDSPTLSLEVNDLMYLTISSDFDYIYKLNPTSSSYRGNSTFFVFKVNASSQSVQDFLVLKLKNDLDSSALDSFISYLMDYTDLLDLESASLKNETLRKIFQQFARKETCSFIRNETENKESILNSLDFHHQVYVDKEKAEMIKTGSEAIGNGIVSLATMASNLIDTIGTQIPMSNGDKTTNKEDKESSSEDSGSSESDSEANSNEDKSKKDSKRHHRHRHSRRHRRRDGEKEDEDQSPSDRRSRRSRRHARRAANLRRLNQFTKQFSQTANVACTAISSALTETASYVIPAVEEYLPQMISKVTNYDEHSSRQMVGSTLGYGKVAMDALGIIKNSVSEGIGIVGNSAATQTTQIVKNRYGDEAAEQTKDVLESAANVANTYTAVKNCKKLI